MKALFTIFYYTLALGALALGALLVLMQTDYLPGYDVRIVQSGSMEPVISTGSVVVIRAEERYAVGDIITFTGSSRDGLPTTHRIIADTVQNGELAYTTKGDANETADIEPVRLSSILGTVLVSIPYLGYVLDFARQPLGFALLIGIPAALIFIEEGSNIYKALRGRRKEFAAQEAEVEEKGGGDTDGSPEKSTHDTR